jgi:hypothetical protein
MEAGNDPATVIEALADYEEAMGALYAVYGDLYPAARDLWRTLSGEEQRHAALLRALPKQTSELAAFLDARRFRLEHVHAETLKLRSAVRTAPVAGIDLLDAFRLALKLENGLIESQVFAVSQDDPPEVVEVLTSLAEETARHRRHLSESFSGNK